jgi:membrane-bound inhibitor of C-type lysozyme
MVPVMPDRSFRLRAAAAVAAGVAWAGMAGGCSWFRSEPSTGVEPKLPTDAVAYKCDQNKRLVVRYPSGGKYAVVMLPDREFRLDAVASASGARYGNGRTTLSTKGDEASLEDQGNLLFANCEAVSAKK